MGTSWHVHRPETQFTQQYQLLAHLSHTQQLFSVVPLLPPSTGDQTHPCACEAGGVLFSYESDPFSPGTNAKPHVVAGAGVHVSPRQLCRLSSSTLYANVWPAGCSPQLPLRLAQALNPMPG